MRRAKKRRRKFAESLQKSANNERHKLIDRNASISSTASSIGSTEGLVDQQKDSRNLMPPPQTPVQKRQSLPAGFDAKENQLENSAGNKRRREDDGGGADQGTPRRTKIHHKRSGTVGDSIMSAPPRPMTRTPYKSRIDVSEVKDGSLLSDILMKQARRLAPNARSDTTRTDYFKLKALGIDPDTSVIPSTKKRSRDEMELTGAESRMGISSSPRIPNSTRLHDFQSATQTQHKSAKVSRPADDDDEELFAQIRSVREALAESERWCKTERESLEKSMTPQPESSTTNGETPAQRRLREIRERGRTPSRTEVRLRAMGEKALLPKGFWDGEGMGMSLTANGKGKGSTTPQTSPPSRKRVQAGAGAPPMGFEALQKNRAQTGGLTNGLSPYARNQPRQAAQTQPEQTGSSAEDAIEL